jgi:hypothetical protein
MGGELVVEIHPQYQRVDLAWTELFVDEFYKCIYSFVPGRFDTEAFQRIVC